MAIPVDMVIEETVRELEEVFGRRLRILERVAITAALEQLIDTSKH